MSIRSVLALELTSVCVQTLGGGAFLGLMIPPPQIPVFYLKTVLVWTETPKDGSDDDIQSRRSCLML